jgi:DNA modification methylase
MKIIEKALTVDIGLVDSWKRNPRDIKRGDLDRLKGQLAEIGVYKPLLCEEVSGRYVVLGGNMRLRALKELNVKEVWISVISVVDEAERVKISLSDNDRAGFYVEELLAEQLRGIEGKIDLKQYCVDIKIPDVNLQDVLDRTLKVDENADEVPEVRESTIKLGDMYKLGCHVLMCGDSTDKASVDRLMGGKQADMVFTDPPYGVAIGDKNKFLNTFQKAGRKLENIKNDALQNKTELKNVLLSAFKNINNVLKSDGTYYVTAPQGGDLGLMMMMMMMMESGLEVKHVLNWVKNSPTFSLGRLDYEYKHEPILYGWKEKHNFYGNGKYKTSIWEYDKPRKCNLHPTMKPVDLIQNALLNSTKPDDIVADIFLGSGSTLIACELTNRICYGMELDPVYCQVIIDRWEKQTNKKAEKL